MATLIMSNFGRCDSSCHGARHAKCVCICGGRYHGAARRTGGVEGAVKEFGAEVLTSLGFSITVPELTQAMLNRARGEGKPVRLKLTRKTPDWLEGSSFFPHQLTLTF